MNRDQLEEMTDAVVDAISELVDARMRVRHHQMNAGPGREAAAAAEFDARTQLSEAIQQLLQPLRGLRR